MNPLTIRDATVGDSEAIWDIYAYYVENTAATFEIETPSLSEFAGRVAAIVADYPYFVCEQDGAVVGYAYASRHREREAYQYDVDVSIYVRNGMGHSGIGTALYEALFDALAERDYYNVYSGITLPNEASVALHHKFGFEDIGVYRKTGFKLGAWHDVLWLDKTLKPHEDKLAQ